MELTDYQTWLLSLLTPVTLDEYRQLPLAERRDRGRAAELSRTLWKRTDEYRLLRQLADLPRSSCRSCGVTAGDRKLHLDHITPLTRGGTHELANLQLLCGPCNSRKRQR